MAKRSTFTPEAARKIARGIQKIDGGQSVPPLSRAASGMGEGWRLLIGKTDAAIAKGASGTISIWDGTQGSESDTGDNVTAYNYFGDIAITKWVGVFETVRGYVIIAAEC